MIADIS